jgi:hypothetical protein
MGRSVARRQLDQAQLVAHQVEPERLGVDGDQWAEIDGGRKVAAMQRDRHGFVTTVGSIILAGGSFG